VCALDHTQNGFCPAENRHDPHGLSPAVSKVSSA
jgi:hypothetical protein